MDVFSEIEIEALVEETYVSAPAEVLGAGDMVAREVELEVLTTFLGGTQNFDAFEPEWLDSAVDISQGINPDAADWLTAFIDGDIESDTTITDKPKVNYTEDIDEVVTTGTINTSWDYADILDFLATIESMGDGILVGDGGDNIGLGDDAPAVGAPIDEVIVTETIVRDGVEWEIPLGYEIIPTTNPLDPFMRNPETGEIFLTPWYAERAEHFTDDFDWVEFWVTLIGLGVFSVGGAGAAGFQAWTLPAGAGLAVIQGPQPNGD